MNVFTFEGNSYVNGEWVSDTLATGSRCSYGDFKKFSGAVTEDLWKSLYILRDELTGSDYSGGSVQRSNHKVFLEKFKDVEGVHNLYGGMGTYSVTIRLDVYENNSDIKETLDSLEDYPVLDGDVVSAIEHEWEVEDMKDIVHSLCNHINLEDYVPDYEPDSDKIEALAWEGITNLNLHWAYENTSAYLDYKSVQPYVEDILLIDNCKELPLLINRAWSCEEARRLYLEKFQE